MADRKKEGLGLLARVIAQTGNPLDWNPLDRCLLLVGILVVVCFLYTIFLTFFIAGELRQILNLELLKLCRDAIFFYGLVLGCFLIAGLRRRKRQREWPFLSYFLSQTFSIMAVLALYAGGIYTSSGGALLISGIALGLPLLDVRAVSYGTTTGLILLLSLMGGQSMGVIPYAPVFKAPPYRPDGYPYAAWSRSQAALILISVVGAWFVVGALLTRWRQREDLFREQSRIDALTGLYNRRHFFEVFRGECRRARRTGAPLSLVMCDADHFKKVNDTYGHTTGDEVLKGISRALVESIRVGIDTVGRLGGEEFGVLLVDAELQEALAVAERMAEAIRTARFEPASTDGSSAAFHITASLGVSTLAGEKADVDTLLEAADSLLYRAKQAGRDRVIAMTVADLAQEPAGN